MEPNFTMSDPSGGSVSEGTGAQVDEVLEEAIRVGAQGDVAGQVELLEISGGRGNPEAFYELARIHLNGVGVARAPETAVGYLSQAIGLGHVEASRVLGWLYVMGSGVERDVEYGRMLLDKAAETSIRAQREYGMALVNLREPHLDDFERGLELLTSAMSAGDAQAERAYRVLFSAGPSGVVESKPVGETLGGDTGSLKERALNGDVAAMYEYALRVSLRQIPDPNPEFTAYCWYSIAAARGHAKAAVETRSLSGVRALADRAEPGRTDRAIAAIDAQIRGKLNAE